MHCSVKINRMEDDIVKPFAMTWKNQYLYSSMVYILYIYSIETKYTTNEFVLHSPATHIFYFTSIYHSRQREGEQKSETEASTRYAACILLPRRAFHPIFLLTFLYWLMTIHPSIQFQSLTISVSTVGPVNLIRIDKILIFFIFRITKFAGSVAKPRREWVCAYRTESNCFLFAVWVLWVCACATRANLLCFRLSFIYSF